MKGAKGVTNSVNLDHTAHYVVFNEWNFNCFWEVPSTL